MLLSSSFLSRLSGIAWGKSFLDQEVGVVDAQGGQFLIRTLEHHQQPAVGYVRAAASKKKGIVVSKIEKRDAFFAVSCVG